MICPFPGNCRVGVRIGDHFLRDIYAALREEITPSFQGLLTAMHPEVADSWLAFLHPIFPKCVIQDFQFICPSQCRIVESQVGFTRANIAFNERGTANVIVVPLTMFHVAQQRARRFWVFWTKCNLFNFKLHVTLRMGCYAPYGMSHPVRYLISTPWTAKAFLFISNSLSHFLSSRRTPQYRVSNRCVSNPRSRIELTSPQSIQIDATDQRQSSHSALHQAKVFL